MKMISIHPFCLTFWLSRLLSENIRTIWSTIVRMKTGCPILNRLLALSAPWSISIQVQQPASKPTRIHFLHTMRIRMGNCTEKKMSNSLLTFITRLTIVTYFSQRSRQQASHKWGRMRRCPLRKSHLTQSLYSPSSSSTSDSWMEPLTHCQWEETSISAEKTWSLNVSSSFQCTSSLSTESWRTQWQMVTTRPSSSTPSRFLATTEAWNISTSNSWQPFTRTSILFKTLFST